MKLARFALNDRTPHADFDLSLYLYGLLIPVGYLVNGRSIIAGVLAELCHSICLQVSFLQLGPR